MSTVNEVNALDVIESRDWPPIPDEIKHLEMKRAEDGSHIICTACEMFDSRKQSQNGKVICRKGRPFQYGMMKDHVYNEFHQVRQIYGRTGVLVEVRRKISSHDLTDPAESYKLYSV